MSADDLIRTEREHFAIFPRDGEPYVLHADERFSFLAAWQAGAAFWEGWSPYGSRVYVKLGDIVGAVYHSDDALEAQREDAATMRARDLTDGG